MLSNNLSYKEIESEKQDLEQRLKESLFELNEIN